MARRTNAAAVNAIKKTLCYKSLFKYPVSFYQLSTYLVTPKEIRNKNLREALNTMVKERWARKSYGKYEISNLEYTNWIWRQKHTSRILKENEELIRFLGKIPWVKMIAATGSVSAYNAEKDSDIDLFIVTGKNRVWITRGFIAAILKVVGKHPQFDGQPGSFCTNLFMDETKMTWDKNKRNLFVASDIAMMQPIVNKSDTYFKFMRDNDWVKEYMANFKIDTTSVDKKPKRSGPLGNILEKTAKKMQLTYMRKKVTNEVLTSHIIHFNKHDNSPDILMRYKQALKDLQKV